MPGCRLHLDGRKKELLDRDVFIARQLVLGLSYQHTTSDKNIMFIDTYCEEQSCGMWSFVAFSGGLQIGMRLHPFFCLEDGGSKFLRSVGKLPDYTVSNAGSLMFVEYFLESFLVTDLVPYFSIDNARVIYTKKV